MGADRQGLAAPRRRRALTSGTLARAAATLVAVLAFFVLFTLPPRATRLDTTLPATAVPGAVHVHSVRAGGSGTADDIAAAAAAAGLKYIVITDHGDATRAADAPAYRHGVLCIDAVEVSTLGGHVVALGLDMPSPYPLAGEARDVVDDVRRLGGRAFAAHADSPRQDLRWVGSAPFDGIEWLNADSEWRDESAWRLGGSALRALVRPAETIVSLFARPAATLTRWDRELATRPVVSVAGSDAHARIGGEDESGRPTGWSLAFPSYAQMFRALSQVALLDAPLTGDAGRDATAVVDALVAGRSFSVVNGIAAPGLLEFFAEQDGRRVSMGEALSPRGSAIFQVAVPGATGAGIALIADGNAFALGRGTLIAQRPVRARSYRVEVYAPGFGVPWMVSNPIFVEPAAPVVSAPPASGVVVAALDDWRVERDQMSSAAIEPTPEGIRLDVALGGGAPAGQYGAAVAAVAPGAGFDRVVFTARASAPGRVSVQVRVPGERDGLRWRRSIYVDATPREFVLPLAEFDAIAHRETLAAHLARVDAALFVVDTLNTTPGSRLAIWVSDARLTRPAR